MQAKEQANPGKKKDIDMTKIRRAKAGKKSDLNFLETQRHIHSYCSKVVDKLLFYRIRSVFNTAQVILLSHHCAYTIHVLSVKEEKFYSSYYFFSFP